MCRSILFFLVMVYYLFLKRNRDKLKLNSTREILQQVKFVTGAFTSKSKKSTFEKSNPKSKRAKTVVRM